ncbi:hypothetical protein C8F01DRAFT_1089890 [Mycena amicta]|nr:hypothetical protein C8F01DRAFT_1094971 [Mycena amicta]KAJ7049823.1 hypothetical protein C8F01DRAFT_1093023 [Mycena amicta]KAJ7053271.1 hypothetical protein C8F01DRAFT_1089890 [Mycena amicta]
MITAAALSVEHFCDLDLNLGCRVRRHKLIALAIPDFLLENRRVEFRMRKTADLGVISNDNALHVGLPERRDVREVLRIECEFSVPGFVPVRECQALVIVPGKKIGSTDEARAFDSHAAVEIRGGLRIAACTVLVGEERERNALAFAEALDDRLRSRQRNILDLLAELNFDIGSSRSFLGRALDSRGNGTVGTVWALTGSNRL